MADAYQKVGRCAYLNGDYAKAKEALADLAAVQGRWEEVLRLYAELEAEMEQSFGEQNPNLIALREKVRNLAP